TNVDDCSGEVLGYVMNRLFEAGAKDVFYTPIYMKKNRPGVKIMDLCQEQDSSAMEDMLFFETNTIGIRKRNERRACLHRKIEEVQTKYGPLQVKKVSFQNNSRRYVEYESAVKIAKQNNIALRDVYK